MLATLLKLLFGNPSAPQESSTPSLGNASDDDASDKNALLSRLMSDGDYFASQHENAPTEKHNNIAAAQDTKSASLENNTTQNIAPPTQATQPEPPREYSDNSVTPQKQQTSAISQKQFDAKVDTTIETANYFYEVIRKAIADERGLHVETAIITAARLCGSLLYRSIAMDTNLKYQNPGTLLIDPRVDKTGREMETLLMATLDRLGVQFDLEAVKKYQNKHTVNEILGQSRLSFLGTLEKIQPFCISFCEITDDYRQAAAATMVSTAMLIRDASTILDVNAAYSMAILGTVQGSKTVPPPANTKDEKIHAEKECDPINRFKNDAEQIYHLVKDYLSLNSGFDLPSLFCALGALAGQSCLQRALTLYEPPENIHSAQALLAEGSLVPIGTENGQELFFGNLLNQPLYESKYSVWNAIHSYLKQLDRQWDLDVNEIFDYVAKSGGKDKFGMLRVPMPNMPRELPIFYLKQLWPTTTEALGKISTNKTDWPFILSGALLHAIDTHKQGSNKLHPALIAKIVMESAVPMSKVPIEPNIALGNYIVNRQPIH